MNDLVLKHTRGRADKLKNTHAASVPLLVDKLGSVSGNAEAFSIF